MVKADKEDLNCAFFPFYCCSETGIEGRPQNNSFKKKK